MALERLQKILARAGVASRRAAEKLILDGRVRVNGRTVTELGARFEPRRDRIELDGRRLAPERLVYFILNKPRGLVTTLDDPEGRDSIADIIKGIPERVFPVGRLDYQTSGALLLTNDGELAQALLHPARRIPRTYIAKLRGVLQIEELNGLREGVALGSGETSGKAEVFVVRQEREHTWLQIGLAEGKNRQIHRMAEAIGRRVMRLSRLSFAGLTVEGLRPGEYRPLAAREVERLRRVVATGKSPKASAKRRARFDTRGNKRNISTRLSRGGAAR
jgi:23S rRNA pseudouridine2605 synthase